MGTISRTVDRHIAAEIAAAGYELAEDLAGRPERGVEWNLSMGDSDGVAFYGSLMGAALEGLAGRLMSGRARSAARRAARKGWAVAIRKRPGGPRDLPAGPDADVLVDSRAAAADLTDAEREALAELSRLIALDSIRLRNRLENECYEIIESALRRPAAPAAPPRLALEAAAWAGA